MHAGKASEGYDLLSRIRMSDLRHIASSEQPDRIVSRVQSIIEQHPDPEASEDGSMMEALIRASKRGIETQTLTVSFGSFVSYFPPTQNCSAFSISRARPPNLWGSGAVDRWGTWN